MTRVGDRISRRNPTIEIWVERDGERKERLFNPYTGADLGDSVTQGEYFVLWLARLHDELLFDRPGRWWNGVLSAVTVRADGDRPGVWWPGVTRWRRSLKIKWSSGWRRFNWDLHSAIGFWLFLFMLMWGVSGFYLGVPEPFSNFVDSISDPDAYLGERPGDIVLMWLTRLHFGRWREMPWLKAVWAVVGLMPALMFVTGARDVVAARDAQAARPRRGGRTRRKPPDARVDRARRLHRSRRRCAWSSGRTRWPGPDRWWCGCAPRRSTTATRPSCADSTWAAPVPRDLVPVSDGAGDVVSVGRRRDAAWRPATASPARSFSRRRRARPRSGRRSTAC